MSEFNTNSIKPEYETRQWLEKVVVGLNLCPFAAPVLKSDTIRITVCKKREVDELLTAVLYELDKLQGSREEDIATSLLIFSHSLKTFNEFWELAGAASELVEEAGLEGIIQIATFHPDYCFEGNNEADIENYTNRSPYPMLHFIREAYLSRALESYRHPEKIPENNVKRLRQLGEKGLSELLKKGE